MVLCPISGDMGVPPSLFPIKGILLRGSEAGAGELNYII